ncbi:MAG: RNA polymerase sigma factor [Flavobacteriales bacterium]|nr:RNA polymerase sigma factor [Flavobacteriales bacterium]
MRLINLGNSEQQLIKKCLKGERKAQKALYDRYSGKMLGVCRRYVRSTYDAEEVLSNGFIKVFNKLEYYQDEGSFEGWIRKIMVREALNFLRSQKDFFDETEDATLERLEPVAEQHELEAQDLMKLIDELPTGYRTVFNLFAIEGYSHQEIAYELSISEGTSKSQLSKARKMLQSRMTELEYQQL